MTIGILAFQGDVAEHALILSRLHIPSVEVRSVEDLARVDALIIPGGESTVIAKFLQETGVGKEVVRRVTLKAEKAERKEGKEGIGMLPANGNRSLIVYGTCAGAIVLAKKVTGKNAPKSLRLIDVTIDRNAYGTQIDSFEAELKISGMQKPVPVAFIRAPKITRIGKGVEILAKFRGEPVFVRQGNVLISTFHPEARGSTLIHELFLSFAKS